MANTLTEQNGTEISADDAYLAKMTLDEVGADIDEHGFVEVTPESATESPYTARGGMVYAFDEMMDSPAPLPKPEVNDVTNGANELTGELEGVDDETKMGEDSAKAVKDSLSSALDAIVEDAADDTISQNGEDIETEKEDNRDKIPTPPTPPGQEDKPDENGLVYFTVDFTVDPEKYISANYRGMNAPKIPKLSFAPNGNEQKEKADPNEEAAYSDLGTPEAKESANEADEPTENEEAAAAREADKELDKSENGERSGVQNEQSGDVAEANGKKADKTAQDEQSEKVAMDYATYLDGSSFMCFDEIADIDYSKIAMDAGPRKKVTRENCETTFAQCRAQNPLFCRFHGPKLLEADIRSAIRGFLGNGFAVSVTKDKNSKNRFAFRLTVGCPPSLKSKAQDLIHKLFRHTPGLTSPESYKDLDGDKWTSEFEMDVLKADQPPKNRDSWEGQAIADRDRAVDKGKKMSVVGQTPTAIESAATEQGAESPEGEQGASEEGQGAVEPQADAPEAAQGEQREEPQEVQPVEKPKRRSRSKAAKAGSPDGDVPPVSPEPESGEVPEPSEEAKSDATPRDDVATEEPPTEQAKEPPVDTAQEPEPEQTSEIPQEPEDATESETPEPSEPEAEATEPRSDDADGATKGDSEESDTKAEKRHIADEFEKTIEEKGRGYADYELEDLRHKMDTAYSLDDLDKMREALKELNEMLDGGEADGGTDGATDDSEQTGGQGKSEVTPQSAASLGLEGIQTAAGVQAAEEAGERAKAVASELTEKARTFGGTSGSDTLARAAAEMAAAAAQQTVTNSHEDVTDGKRSLQQQRSDNYRQTEEAAKGEASEAVRTAMSDMAKVVFSTDSKARTVADSAQELIDGISALAKEKGLDGYKPKNGEQIAALQSSLSELSDKMDSLMKSMGEAMDKTGDGFQAEDVAHYSHMVKNVANQITAGFVSLMGLVNTEQMGIETAAAVKDAKKELKSEASKKGGLLAEYNSMFTYDAYGEMPNEDESDAYIGGSGDVMGSKLLQFAAENDGILKLPKGFGQYFAAKARYRNARGQARMRMKEPRMSDYGIVCPMADYIDGLLDGGISKNKGVFRLLFGFKPKEGNNDQKPDTVPEDLASYFEENDLEKICGDLIEAQKNYRSWVNRATSHYRKAKQDEKDRKEWANMITLEEVEEKDAADAEYDNAFAEVMRYESGSPTIKYFDRENMRKLQKGDVVRFDHDDFNWHFKDYDTANDILSVVPWGTEDEPIWGDEDKPTYFRISEHGIEEVKPETEDKEKEGENDNGQEAENRGSETGSGDAGVPQSGTEGEVDGEAKQGGGTDAGAKTDSVVSSEPFSLESLTEGEDIAERKRRKTQKAIKQGQERELHGSAGEVNQGLLDLGGAEGEDLFNRTVRTEESPKAEEKPSSGSQTGGKASGGREATNKAIADIYKDWVQEDIPDWVGGLSDDEAAHYVKLMENARDNSEDDSEAFNNLLKFEDEHSKGKPSPAPVEKPKETAAVEATAKAKPKAPVSSSPAKKESPKKPVSATPSSAQVRKIDQKELMSAIQRVGMEAFQPESLLRRALNNAKHFASGNPRMAQKVKDIEMILADRADKAAAAKRGDVRQGGTYAAAVDSMPEQALLKEYMAEMLISQ